MATIYQITAICMIVVLTVISSANGDVDQHRHLTWEEVLNHYTGHIGGHGSGYHVGYSLFGYCREGRICCQYPLGSSEYHACCNTYGCCPSCENHAWGCRCGFYCSRRGGICRRGYCEAGETLSWGCRGRGCYCCIRDPVEVTVDCEGASECCGLEMGTGEFYECCQKYSCCPVCEQPACSFGNETFEAGSVIRSYPERCLQLICEVQETDTSPFFQDHIVEASPENSTCGCCILGGEMYENGYLLTQDDYCLAVQCEDGQWVNQGFFNLDCSNCVVQDPLAAVFTLDGTMGSVTDANCEYSVVQEGSTYDPDSYVYVNFNPSTISGLVDRDTIVWQDSGSDVITCPADDIQGCTFGAITDLPKEVTDVGTLAFTMSIGSVTFNVIMGTNKVMTMYNDNTLIIFAPNSKYDQLGGMCASVYNGDPSDDLTSRGGTLETDFATFVESWKTDPSCISGVRRELKNHDGDYCASVSSTNIEDYNKSCVAILGAAFTDSQMDECMQIMCMCEQSGFDNCQAIFNDIAGLEQAIDTLKKSPIELAELLQSF